MDGHLPPNPPHMDQNIDVDINDDNKVNEDDISEEEAAKLLELSDEAAKIMDTSLEQVKAEQKKDNVGEDADSDEYSKAINSNAEDKVGKKHHGAHFLLRPFDVNPVKFLKYLRDFNLTLIESLFKGETHQTFKRVTRVLKRYV